MSDIPTLQWLVDWINVGVAIALAASFVFGAASIFLSKRLNAVKDERATREKQASDERIAAANEEAAKANREATRVENEGKERVAKVEADAQKEIARLTAEAEKARANIATAQTDAAQANEAAGRANERAAEIARENIELKGALDRATAEARREAEELRRQNLATEDRLEKERNTRLELEKALAPRTFPARFARPLKQFAGMQVTFLVVDDFDARRVASFIAGALEMEAGWKILDVKLIPPDALFPSNEGVMVELSANHTEGKNVSFEASFMLLNALEDSGNVIMPGGVAHDIPAGSLKVGRRLKAEYIFSAGGIKERQNGYAEKNEGTQR